MQLHLWMLALAGSIQQAVAKPISTAQDLVAALRRGEDVSPSIFKGGLKAQVHGPEWPQWENETERWSTFSAPTFELVFTPQTETDLTQGLKILTTNNVPFLAQGGGHGYSPTLGSIQNAVLINLKNFDKIQVGKDGILTIGGAARFGDMYTALHAKGREITLGSCPCVGATGATLGGGHGRLQGLHGLSADALQKVRLALWDGSVVEASASKNAELFWGLRGAGQNFGVVIESTFKTYPETNKGLHYNADMVFSDDSLEGVLDTINKLIPSQDPALAIDVIFFADPATLNPIVFVNLVYAGTQAKGEKYANLFATRPQAGTTRSITRLSNTASMLSWDQLPYLSAGGAIAAACVKGIRQNTYTANLRQFDLNQTSTLYKDFGAFVKANPKASGSLVLYEVFGQAAVLSATPTSAANREFGNILTLVEMAYLDDSVAAVADAWGKRWRNVMAQPKVSGYDRLYVYQNYAHGDEPLQALYGYEPDRLARLSKLKSRYDPRGFFNGYHAIPPAK
jgi:FAD/FMN-containing dehydrogenase